MFDDILEIICIIIEKFIFIQECFPEKRCMDELPGIGWIWKLHYENGILTVKFDPTIRKPNLVNQMRKVKE